MKSIPSMPNGAMIALNKIPLLDHATFADTLDKAFNKGQRLAAFFAVPDEKEREAVILYAVTASAKNGMLHLIGHQPDIGFPSLTPLFPQLHLFEREIAEQYGISFTDHPWLKPVRFHAPLGRSNRNHPLIGDMEYFRVEGDEIHEVGVGPVHAGVIEPGHFRFQCHGEKVLHMEISLGYQHRDIEQMLINGPNPRTPMLIETMAGDTSIGHMSAYSMVCEALTGCKITPRAAALRCAALELERLANHVGDIGALAGDVGYLPTASFCGRLRGDYLNMTAALCGSRFGRGLVRPGGTLFNADNKLCATILSGLDAATEHTDGALRLFFNTSSVLARLEGTGTVDAETAHSLGLVGVAARACGIDCDTRRFFTGGQYEPDGIPPILEESGDVLARALVRHREIDNATDCIRSRLNNLPEGECLVKTNKPAPNAMAVAMTEAWRGAVTHVALTDEHSRFRRYKVVDPSFFNWSGLAMALREEQISDFPLCNKSFNLSYCGFDL